MGLSEQQVREIVREEVAVALQEYRPLLASETARSLADSFENLLSERGTLESP